MARKNRLHDPGLGQRFSKRTAQKSINNDGSFNVKRIGGFSFFSDTYHYLVHLSWPTFTFYTFLFYFGVNLLFAGLYYLQGAQHLTGANMESDADQFLSAFFFSIQTFTTVGYGSIAPKGITVSFIAAIEALIGLMSFALITGLLYGRFSKPSAKILFSKNALISPYEDSATGLMFRIANQRRSEMIEVSATVIMISVDKNGEGYSRNFDNLELEVDSIKFLPLNWTIVHPINEKSPLYKKGKHFFEDHDVEFLVLIKAFDDTFSQTVYARYAYKWDEIVWGAKFVKPFYIDDDGLVVMDLTKINDFEMKPLPN